MNDSDVQDTLDTYLQSLTIPGEPPVVWPNLHASETKPRLEVSFHVDRPASISYLSRQRRNFTYMIVVVVDAGKGAQE